MGTDAPRSRFSPGLAGELKKLRETPALVEEKGFVLPTETPFLPAERTRTIEMPYDNTPELRRLGAERIEQQPRGGVGVPPEKSVIEPSAEYATHIAERKQWDALHAEPTIESPFRQGPGAKTAGKPDIGEDIVKQRNAGRKRNRFCSPLLSVVNMIPWQN